jgi:hypothetical protein
MARHQGQHHRQLTVQLRSPKRLLTLAWPLVLAATALAGETAAPPTAPTPRPAATQTQTEAAPAAATESAKPAFDLQASEQTIPGAGNILRCYLTTETHRFSFVMPPGMRSTADPERRTISLTSSDFTCAMEVEIVEPKGQSVPSVQAEALRHVVLRRFPGGRILGEFTASAAGRGGPGFDVERTLELNSNLRARIAFVPFSGGLLEFKLTTTPEKFPAFQHRFNQWMLSFRVGPLHEPVEVQPVVPD